MISGAYFTENYPLQLPPKLGVKKNSMVQTWEDYFSSHGPKTYQIHWEWSQNATLKAILTLDKNYSLQPPALEVTKIVVEKLIKFISNNPKVHRFKATLTVREKRPVFWWYISVSFHDIAMFSENYAPM